MKERKIEISVEQVKMLNARLSEIVGKPTTKSIFYKIFDEIGLTFSAFNKQLFMQFLQKENVLIKSSQGVQVFYTPKPKISKNPALLQFVDRNLERDFIAYKKAYNKKSATKKTVVDTDLLTAKQFLLDELNKKIDEFKREIELLENKKKLISEI